MLRRVAQIKRLSRQTFCSQQHTKYEDYFQKRKQRILDSENKEEKSKLDQALPEIPESELK